MSRESKKEISKSHCSQIVIKYSFYHFIFHTSNRNVNSRRNNY